MPRKYEIQKITLIPGCMEHAKEREPMAIAAAIRDARSVDRLFVVGSPGRRTECMSPKTVSSYKHYWMFFVDWCEPNEQCALPASPATVRAFIRTRFDLATPLGAVRKQTAYAMLAAIEHANVQLTRYYGLYRSAIEFLKSFDDAPITLTIIDRKPWNDSSYRLATVWNTFG